MIRKKLIYQGGSLLVLLPKPFADLMGLTPESMVEIDYANQKMIVSAAKSNGGESHE